MIVTERREVTLEDGPFKAIIQIDPKGTKIRIINVGSGQRQDGMKPIQIDLDPEGLIALHQFTLDLQGHVCR